MALSVVTEPGLSAVDPDRADAALAAGGDTAAFERLYRRHTVRIHSLARRMIGAEYADELTQDVFVRAWQKLALFRGEAAFGTWLHRLAINVMLARRGELARRRERFARDEQALASVASRSAGSDARLDFEAALQQLPGGAREIFVLHDIEGYKHEEIAQMLNVSPGTSKSQLHRARMALRQHLG